MAGIPISITVPALTACACHYVQKCSEVSLKPANNGAQDWAIILWEVRLPGPSAGQSIGAGTNPISVI